MSYQRYPKDSPYSPQWYQTFQRQSSNLLRQFRSRHYEPLPPFPSWEEMKKNLVQSKRWKADTFRNEETYHEGMGIISLFPFIIHHFQTFLSTCFPHYEEETDPDKRNEITTWIHETLSKLFQRPHFPKNQQQLSSFFLQQMKCHLQKRQPEFDRDLIHKIRQQRRPVQEQLFSQINDEIILPDGIHPSFVKQYIRKEMKKEEFVHLQPKHLEQRIRKKYLSKIMELSMLFEKIKKQWPQNFPWNQQKTPERIFGLLFRHESEWSSLPFVEIKKRILSHFHVQQKRTPPFMPVGQLSSIKTDQHLLDQKFPQW